MELQYSGFSRTMAGVRQPSGSDTKSVNGVTCGFRDSAFTKNRELPVHRWVPWIAGFSAQFVDDCLSKYLNQRDPKAAWVLDPFAGVGTTLLEGYVRGFNVVGFEINPYAALASATKLEADQISPEALRAQVNGFTRFMDRRLLSSNGTPRSHPPAGFSGRTEFFSPAVERKVLFALDYINGIGDPALRNLFRLAFGSVMVSFSNYSYEPSLTRRIAVGKQPITEYNVGLAVRKKLEMMANDVEWLRAKMRKIGTRPTARVHADSFFEATRKLRRKAFVDLLVTSPPYLNNYHYPRNTRPQLHWLGFTSGPGYEGAKESKSFGTFWQTVREKERISLSFDFPELEETIARIRARNTDKGSYGGPGWANYVATYFNDALRFWKVAGSLLKPDGVAVVVLGNSIIQGVEVKTDWFFGRIAEQCGFTFEDAIRLRDKRTGTSIIQSSVRADKAAVRTVLYESAIVLRR
jgi:DNA modification methylase